MKRPWTSFESGSRKTKALCLFQPGYRASTCGSNTTGSSTNPLGPTPSGYIKNWNYRSRTDLSERLLTTQESGSLRQPILDLMADLNLKSLLPRGTITYSSGQWNSAIDFKWFCGNPISNGACNDIMYIDRQPLHITHC